MKKPKLLLIHPPLSVVAIPNLGIEKLANLYRVSGGICDTLYLNLRLDIPPWLIQDAIGPSIFAPFYYGLDSDQIWKEVEAIYTSSMPNWCQKSNEVRQGFTAAVGAVDDLLEWTSKHVASNYYDLVGFSIIFDSQKLPSASIAKAIKAVSPETKIMCGGTGVDAEMGKATMQIFRELDFVLQGEAEHTFVRAIDSIFGDSISKPTNFLFRDRSGQLNRTEYEEQTPDLRGGLTADFQQFLRQIENSKYASSQRILMYEASRGCWWGKKNHCEFCGIRSVRFPYREISPSDVLADLLKLDGDFHPDFIYFTDAIASMNLLREVLPELAKLRKQGKFVANIFLETKSNLRRHDVALLAASGVSWIQPGIETFLTNSLRLMRKGTTGMQQIELLKWCAAYGIDVSYGLLIGTLGESIDDLWDLGEVLWPLRYYRAPTSINRLALHRFSPYFDSPEKYGITGVRPFAYQRTLYRAEDKLLLDLCYELDFDSELIGHPQFDAALTALRSRINTWANGLNRGAQYSYIDLGTDVLLLSTNAEGNSCTTLRNSAAQIMRLCETAVSRAKLADGMREWCEAPTFQMILTDLIDREIVFELDDRLLTIPLPSRVDAWRDANLDPDRPDSSIQTVQEFKTISIVSK